MNTLMKGEYKASNGVNPNTTTSALEWFRHLLSDVSMAIYLHLIYKSIMNKP